MAQLLEHEAKALARAAGLEVPAGAPATTADEAAAVAAGLGDRVVVKAQVPTGRRGRAGGVRICPRERAGEVAGELLGSRLLGHRVDSVLVEEHLEAVDELYVGLTVDGNRAAPVLLASARGGVDVESGAQVHLAARPVSMLLGLRDWDAWEVVRTAGLPEAAADGVVRLARALWHLFVERRAELVEVNPAVLTADGRLVAVDVRVVEVQGGQRPVVGPGSRGRADPRRASGGPSCGAPPTTACELGFDLVELDADGDCGLITTGAGASMLLIDLLGDAGVRAIDFCDLRTGREEGRRERIGLVLDRVLAAPNLRCVGVNVFAGVTRLGGFATDLADVLEQRAPRVPVVARVEGAGAAEARQLLGQVAECVDSLDALVARVAGLVHSGSAEQVGP